MKRVLFVLLILFLPSQLGYHFWPPWSLVNGIRVDYLSPTMYFTDILCIGLILLEIRKLRLSLLFIFLFLGLVLNIFISSSLYVSLYSWLKIIEFILVGVVVYKNKALFTRLTIAVLPYTLLWTGVLSIAQWLHGGSLNGIFYWLGERSFTSQTPGIALSKITSTVSLRPYATLPHPNVLAGVIVASWLFLLRNQQKNTLFYVTSTLSLIVLLLTESYNAWLALIVCGVFLLFKKHVKSQIRKVWILFISGVFVLSLSALFFVHNPPTQSLDFNTSRERLELLYLSGVTISHQPFTGTGAGTFITQIPQNTNALPPIYRTRSTSWLQPVHNVPLLLLSETGLVGLISSFLLLTALPMTAPLVFILATSLFDHYWITLQAPALLFAILVALTYNTTKSP